MSRFETETENENRPWIHILGHKCDSEFLRCVSGGRLKAYFFFLLSSFVKSLKRESTLDQPQLELKPPLTQRKENTFTTGSLQELHKDLHLTVAKSQIQNRI